MKSLAETLLPHADGTIRTLLDRVALRFDVTVADILGKDRHRHIAHARHVAMWALRQRNLSYPSIGRAVGNRDHTTAMNAVRKVQREYDSSPSVAAELDRLINPVRMRVETGEDQEVRVA